MKKSITLIDIAESVDAYNADPPAAVWSGNVGAGYKLKSKRIYRGNRKKGRKEPYRHKDLYDRERPR